MLLTSKLSLPDIPETFLERQRLREQLSSCSCDQLVLITAPAGYGKTSLVADWVATLEHPVAWLSLDKADNEPSQFCRYLIESIHLATGNGVPECRKMVAANPKEDPTLLMSQLFAELRYLSSELRIVLDDYHQIDNPDVHEITRFLLRHAPAGIGIVITSRSQPPLGLASLRLQGRLAELDNRELALTAAEIGEMLSQRLPFSLRSDRVEQVLQITEGWPPAVQLLGLTVRDEQELDKTVKDLERGHSHILDYLAEEVLERLPEDLRNFLASTCILSRINADLAESLSGLPNGQQLLEQVASRGLFLQALDSSREWFRYHPVFARFLQRQLLDQDKSRALHLKASDSWQAAGQHMEALRHALRAGDPERVQELLQASGELLLREGQHRMLGECFEWLGEDALKRSAHFTLLAAKLARDQYEYDKAEKLLASAESWLTRHDREQWARHDGAFATVRAQAAVARGNTLAAVEYASAALEQLQPEQTGERISALLVTGEASFCLGELAQAQAHMEEVEGLAHSEADYPSEAWALCQQTEIAIASGKLKKATLLQKKAHKLVEEHHLGGLPIAEFISRLAAQLQWESFDLEAAGNSARRGMQINRKVGERWLLPEYTLLLKIAWARGEKEECEEWLARIDQLLSSERYHRDWVANADSTRMLVWRALRDNEPIAAWLESAEPVADSPNNHFEQCHGRNHVRALVELGRWSDAGRVLTRLERAGTQCGLVTDSLRNSILRAQLQWLQEQRDEALQTLRGALQVSLESNYVASFLQLGKLLIVMLKALLQAEGGDVPLDEALRARAEQLVKVAQQIPELDGGISIELDAAIIEEILSSDAVPDVLRHSPLTPREWQVLNAIHSGLSNERIARHFKVAPSTIKTHIRSLYQKLDVRDRQEAIALAERMLRSVQDR
ncbi:HTH-type transcriptional regulator MalT [Biformimicrobium ophioploci]|uniref:HTH-type transcriptional regulator MalT n=1 Tax=Biformimicrobium ophioploci TaxID=3036711 RepID=A0ABQ6M102_9GAMM|nr:HTH-type transcriptional regulator MalT [Microbulbifer sp. NKW57]GMG88044.1 HTH-type transcriptional regulator MalT [Microbulbifer sp. NKW57]